MELKDLLDLHEKLESRINAYWSYWSVAIFAISGWLFSGRQTLSQDQAIGVSIAVMVFFFANLGVLWPALTTAWLMRSNSSGVNKLTLSRIVCNSYSCSSSQSLCPSIYPKGHKCRIVLCWLANSCMRS